MKFIDELKTSLQARSIKVAFSEAVIDHLAAVGYDPRMGARPLSRKIDELIRVPLSRKILFDQLQDVTVTVDFADNTVTFAVVNDSVTVPEPCL